MNINYQFNDVVGSIYKNGNILFFPDGLNLLSPIGNKLKLFDLKRNLSRTLHSQSRANILQVTVNPLGSHALLVNEIGQCMYVNLLNDVILHQFSVGNGSRIKSVQFSPDGRYVAIGVHGIIKVYSVTSWKTVRFNPFILVHRFKHSVDSVHSIDWSDDGRLIVAGGENRVAKVFLALKYSFVNVAVYNLNERAALVNAYFYRKDNYDVLCLDRSGKASVWESSLQPNQLIPFKKETGENSSSYDRLTYKRIRRQDLSQYSGSSGPSVNVLASAINKTKKLLVVAFSTGTFCLCEIPEFIQLQNFRVSDLRINTLAINSFGDWVAIGCGQGSEAQLVVWEWQSETFVMKQQSHSEMITSAVYSPDGATLATGAEDGKVKIWDCQTSFCLVTFTDHNSGISDICFTQSGKAILSASLEGAVRAHDLKRYRNFRTMVAPKQTQLSMLCTDQSGDLVMAASRDQFEVYVWSMENGKLLEVLAGHSSLISSISCYESTLATVSLDKTLRLWNIFEASCVETLQLLNEGLDVKYSPFGTTLAVLCYDSCISLFDTRNTQEIGTIDTRLDIDAGRQKRERIKKSTSEKNKTFTCIAFSPDGHLILAGGQSNTFCLYSVPDRILVRSFRLTANISLDGVSFDINYRKLTEFGNVDLFDVSDSEEEVFHGNKRIPLPGTRHSDLSERSVKPTIYISRLAFSPTGQSFAVVSPEGVSTFALNVRRRFDPFQLESEITPASVHCALKERQFTRAVGMALRLNDTELIRRAVESIPSDKIRLIVQDLELLYAEKLLQWIANEGNSGIALPRHLHFYQLLLKELLYFYGADLKASLQQNLPTITAIQQMLARQQNLLLKMCNQNKHSLEYLLAVRKMGATKIAD